MLIGFLIRDENDWEDWKRRIREVKGKGIVQVYEKEPPGGGKKERKEAVDEVETFDDEDDTVTVTGKEEDGEREREVVAMEPGREGERGLGSQFEGDEGRGKERDKEMEI